MAGAATCMPRQAVLIGWSKLILAGFADCGTPVGHSDLPQSLSRYQSQIRRKKWHLRENSQLPENQSSLNT
jgi:hypothetical protein